MEGEIIFFNMFKIAETRLNFKKIPDLPPRLPVRPAAFTGGGKGSVEKIEKNWRKPNQHFQLNCLRKSSKNVYQKCSKHVGSVLIVTRKTTSKVPAEHSLSTLLYCRGLSLSLANQGTSASTVSLYITWQIYADHSSNNTNLIFLDSKKFHSKLCKYYDIVFKIFKKIQGAKMDIFSAFVLKLPFPPR